MGAVELVGIELITSNGIFMIVHVGFVIVALYRYIFVIMGCGRKCLFIRIDRARAIRCSARTGKHAVCAIVFHSVCRHGCCEGEE